MENNNPKQPGRGKYAPNTEESIDGPSQRQGKIGKVTYIGYERPPTFQRRFHNSNEIQRARSKWRASRDMMRDEIEHFLSNKATNPYLGATFEDLVKQVKENGEDLKKLAKQYEDAILPKGFTNQELGITPEDRQSAKKMMYQLENEYLLDHKKLPILDSTAIEQLKNTYHLDDLSHRTIKNLILLDDPVEKIRGFLQKYRTPISTAVDLTLPAYAPWIRAILAHFLGNPTSTTGHLKQIKSDKPTSFTPAFNNSRLPNQDYVSPQSFQNATVTGFGHLNTVAYDAIATILAPEKYKFRVYSPRPQRTAIANTTNLYTLTADANGNAFYLINPLNPFTNSSTGTQPINVPFEFVQLVGWTPAGTYNTYNVSRGSLYNNQAAIRSGKLAGCAINVIPLTSALNNAGIIRIAYLENYSNFDFNSGSTDLSLSTMAINPYFQEGNLTSSYRAIYLPDEADILSTDLQNNPFSDGFIICITNANPGPVATLEYSRVTEVMPTQASIAVMPVEYPTPGPATLSSIASAIVKNPSLQMLPSDCAYKLAKQLMGKGPSLLYETAMKLMADFTSESLKHKTGPSYQGNSNLAPLAEANEDSEFEIEESSSISHS